MHIIIQFQNIYCLVYLPVAELQRVKECLDTLMLKETYKNKNAKQAELHNTCSVQLKSSSYQIHRVELYIQHKESTLLFRTANRTLDKRHHDNGYKGSLNKFQRLNITQSSFANHNTLTSKINNKIIAKISIHLETKQCIKLTLG